MEAIIACRSMTVEFSTDGSVVGAGFVATVRSYGLFKYGLLVMANIVMAQIVMAYIVMAKDPLALSTWSCRSPMY